MNGKLNGKRIAILVDEGFEEVEMIKPRQALLDAGAQVDLISPHGKVKAWNMTEWGKEYKADKTIGMLGSAAPDDYDGLVLPGGVMNPDKLRINDKAVKFIRSFFEAGKPVAAICHGPWTLIEAGVVRGRKMTSWPSLQTDLRNAGAQWVDETVVTDQGLVTSRKPDDLPNFNAKMIEEFAEGYHAGQHAAASRSQVAQHT